MWQFFFFFLLLFILLSFSLGRGYIVVCSFVKWFEETENLFISCEETANISYSFTSSFIYFKPIRILLDTGMMVRVFANGLGCDDTPSAPPIHQLLQTISLLGRWSTSGSDRGIAHFFIATRNTIKGVGGKRTNEQNTWVNSRCKRGVM